MYNKCFNVREHVSLIIYSYNLQGVLGSSAAKSERHCFWDVSTLGVSDLAQASKSAPKPKNKHKKTLQTPGKKNY